MRARAPRLAVVDTVRRAPLEPLGLAGLPGRHSGEAHGVRLVPPDAATCPACLRELFDPADRRFRYPFINCTDCGPRFTIDRGAALRPGAHDDAGFPLCARLPARVRGPGRPALPRRADRVPGVRPARCGLRRRAGRAGDDPLAAAAAVLTRRRDRGAQGLGGFHLACDATDETAVARLRARKHRPREAVRGDGRERPGRTRPLVQRLGGRASRARVAGARRSCSWPQAAGGSRPSVAPGHRRLGAMLPYDAAAPPAAARSAVRS